jgi:hypothetical protein
MRLLLEENEKMENVLNSIAHNIEGRWYYIPGWFEKKENGEIQFHGMEKLPKELETTLQKIKKQQNPNLKENTESKKK